MFSQQKYFARNIKVSKNSMPEASEMGEIEDADIVKIYFKYRIIF